MNACGKVRSLSIALVVLSAALPVRASLFDSRAFVDVKVTLTQPALCDGSVKLAPGSYDVHLTTTADGSVQAVFFQGGVKRGEARGIIAVRKAGADRAHTFSSLGFQSSSPSALKQNGQKLSLEIGAPGASQILIGLLLPAVRTGFADGSVHPATSVPNDAKIQSPAGQKGP